MTDSILNERTIEAFVKSWTLTPSKGGVFEVRINGELVFSKKALGRHAQPGELRELIVRKRDELLPEDFVMPVFEEER